MSQFSLSTITTTTTNTNTNSTSHFSSLLLSDFFLFCSFILTHPLYFSYFIFFSPYLLKLLSFLSPLFLTTSLLLLAILTINNHSSVLQASSSESKLSFFLTTYHTILNTLASRLDDESIEFHLFEEFESFVVAFESSSFIVEENWNDNTRDIECLHEDVTTCNVEEKMVEFMQKKSEGGGNSLEVLLTCNVEEKLLVEAKVEEKKDNKVELEYTSNQILENPKMLGSNNLTTCGSMRKEKEWKRTLACKLYEERKNVDGGEGMDLLWETYEVDSSKVKVNNKEKKKVKNKKSETEYYDIDDDEEEEEEEDMDGQLCCLQALRFSTGKMNLGMGMRPNLVKISKALKGIGWFHHVSKHGKKGKKLD